MHTHYDEKERKMSASNGTIFHTHIQIHRHPFVDHFRWEHSIEHKNIYNVSINFDSIAKRSIFDKML